MHILLNMFTRVAIKKEDKQRTKWCFMMNEDEIKQLLRLGLWEQALIQLADKTAFIKHYDSVITLFSDWDSEDWYRALHVRLDDAEV